MRFQIRSEFYNAFNNTSFQEMSRTITAPDFGQCDGSTNDFSSVNYLTSGAVNVPAEGTAKMSFDHYIATETGLMSTPTSSSPSYRHARSYVPRPDPEPMSAIRPRASSSHRTQLWSMPDS